MKKIVLFGLVLAFCLALCACGAGSEGAATTTVHEHSFVQGKCSVCGEAQLGYKALKTCGWETAGVTADGTELDVVTLWFGGQEAAISVSFYGPVENLDKETQDYYLTEESQSLYECEGKKYVPKGFGDERPIQVEEQENTVVVSVMEDAVIGKITMVRTSADQYTITEISGRIIDEIITESLKVGSVLTAKG